VCVYLLGRVTLSDGALEFGLQLLQLLQLLLGGACLRCLLLQQLLQLRRPVLQLRRLLLQQLLGGAQLRGLLLQQRCLLLQLLLQLARVAGGRLHALDTRRYCLGRYGASVTIGLGSVFFFCFFFSFFFLSAVFCGAIEVHLFARSGWHVRVRGCGVCGRMRSVCVWHVRVSSCDR
jgi:hypothetical protein